MMIQAVLSNPSHPEYGVATIPFPIPRDQYAHCMEMLEALEIGDALKADCKVEKIDSFYSVLKRTEMLTVNMEELNYLAKRLESFDTGEAAQFQAMAHKLELFELKDLINLTFCCQQATVITDFSDLAAIGRDHYMNLHGGSASVDELNALDGEETARRLIESGGGTITPYGVVYDSGMKLEQVYDGRFFPCYYYEPNAITVAVTSKAEPEDTEHITWLFLPMVQEEIDRALLRGGITDPSEIRLSLEDSWLPHEVLDLLDMDHVDISELNALVQALDEFSDMSIALMDKVKNADEHIWYAEQVAKNGWSRNVLVHQIESGLHQRQVLAEKVSNFESRLPSPQSELAAQTIKDPYIFDFIPFKEDMVERDIEQALVKDVTKLLLELGTGFAFLGNQYHLNVGGDDFYIDLLFYNLNLRCYVVIELKTGEFKPEYAGQLNFYLSAVDGILKKEQDNSSIGLLLCKSKNDLVAEYSLKDMSKPIGVSAYQITSNLPEELERQLPSVEDIQKRIKGV